MWLYHHDRTCEQDSTTLRQLVGVCTPAHQHMRARFHNSTLARRRVHASSCCFSANAHLFRTGALSIAAMVQPRASGSCTASFCCAARPRCGCLLLWCCCLCLAFSAPGCRGLENGYGTRPGEQAPHHGTGPSRIVF